MDVLPGADPVEQRLTLDPPLLVLGSRLGVKVLDDRLEQLEVATTLGHQHRYGFVRLVAKPPVRAAKLVDDVQPCAVPVRLSDAFGGTLGLGMFATPRTRTFRPGGGRRKYGNAQENIPCPKLTKAALSLGSTRTSRTPGPPFQRGAGGA